MLLLEDPVLLDEGVDAVDHLLDELDLAVAQPVLVGNVVGDALKQKREKIKFKAARSRTNFIFSFYILLCVNK